MKEIYCSDCRITAKKISKNGYKCTNCGKLITVSPIGRVIQNQSPYFKRYGVEGTK